jgi:hypothetical protein
MTDKFIFMAFSAAAVAFVLFAVVLINDKAERCEAVGGHILNVYKGSLCVRDGLIVEDY